MLPENSSIPAPTPTSLQVRLDAEIAVLTARERVTLLESGPPLVRPDDTTAIISGVLAVRIDSRLDDCSPRRQRIYFDGTGGTAIVLAPTRPMPVHLKGRKCLIQKARRRGGRRITVSCLDIETSTLYVLVDLARARPVTTETDRDARLLIDLVYGDPIRELLSREQPLHVGEKLVQTTIHLLGSLRRSRDDALKKELRLLTTLIQGGHVPRSLQSRADRIQKWLDENQGEPQMKLPVPPATDGEGSRLTHLVSSRACGYIHIAPGEIRGLANPRLVNEYGLHPRLFRLRLPGRGEDMSLDFWDPCAPKPRREPACLGRAASVFLRFQKMQDIYGTVDFILGFLETNGIGVFPLAGKPASRRRQYLPDDFFFRGDF